MTLFVAHRIVWLFSDLVCIKISFIHRLLLPAHLVAKVRAGFCMASTSLGLDWNEFYSRPASSANITISNAFPVLSKFHAIPRLSQWTSTITGYLNEVKNMIILKDKWLGLNVHFSPNTKQIVVGNNDFQGRFQICNRKLDSAQNICELKIFGKIAFRLLMLTLIDQSGIFLLSQYQSFLSRCKIVPSWNNNDTAFEFIGKSWSWSMRRRVLKQFVNVKSWKVQGPGQSSLSNTSMDNGQLREAIPE